MPDLVAAGVQDRSSRGVDRSAELAVEIRSPHDEIDDKLPWYAERVTETLVITPEPLTVELHRSAVDVGEGPGTADCRTLGCRLAIDGQLLHVTWDDGAASFDLGTIG